ncbi:hypothetical protein LCGC14_2270370 [marine sediment metagenome]|uniref:Uncharacterized protein n=1 Tax=marine sediment metagenome TaxID=412755 RepID=A0A0F9DJD0_9ZZZZ
MDLFRETNLIEKLMDVIAINIGEDENPKAFRMSHALLDVIEKNMKKRMEAV